MITCSLLQRDQRPSQGADCERAHRFRWRHIEARQSTLSVRPQSRLDRSLIRCAPNAGRRIQTVRC